jgi:hypothetical protein
MLAQVSGRLAQRVFDFGCHPASVISGPTTAERRTFYVVFRVSGGGTVLESDCIAVLVK